VRRPPGALSPGREPRPAPVGGQKPGWEGAPSPDSLRCAGSYSPPKVDTSRGRGRLAAGLRSWAPLARFPTSASLPRQCAVTAVRGLNARVFEPRVGSVANRSVLHPTRLVTRTKESNVCASHGDSCIETHGRNESEGGLRPFPRQDPVPLLSARAHCRPVSAALFARRSKSAHVGTRKMVNYA